MLEDLALDYSSMSEVAVFALNWVALVIGGFVGGITNRSISTISRAPYFALNAAVFLAVSAMLYPTVHLSVPALAGQYYWTIVALIFATMLVSGFLFARIGMARSRDIGKNQWLGFLTFVPLANLWLLFTEPAKSTDAYRLKMGVFLTGGVGVFLGLIMIGGSRILDRYTLDESVRRIQAAEAQGVFDVAMLERSLATVVAETTLPEVIDADTTLIGADALGKELRYTYQLSSAVEELPYGFHDGLVQTICEDSAMDRLIAAGAQLTFVYVRTDKSELIRVEISQKDCTA